MEYWHGDQKENSIQIYNIEKYYNAVLEIRRGRKFILSKEIKWPYFSLLLIWGGLLKRMEANKSLFRMEANKYLFIF